MKFLKCFLDIKYLTLIGMLSFLTFENGSIA